MNILDKTYEPSAIEQQWYQTWESRGYFSPQGNGAAYCIMLPPPNITGSLHMGHGFGFTLIDVLIRYQRMNGKKTLWQAGTDHAGISTQMVVERQLNLQGKTRHDYGREAFIEKVWEWKAESGGNITRQLRRLGASMDWSRERFTLDEPLSQAVREVFIRLFDEGLIYRGERLVNWDPSILTAVSDLEVVNEEAEGHLWHIRYPFAEAEGHLVVATTRPETLLGDVAVAVHPEDQRYQSFIGKNLKLPLTDRLIPVIADTEVDPSFGSGCVKITPAHDFNDYAMGQRHRLSPINIFTPDAHINQNAPGEYQGLERFQARKKIVADLEALTLLEKVEKHRLNIPRGERTGAIIEPYLTQQWFMKMKPLAEPAIKAVETGETKFIPENWNKTYFQWMHQIEDWCISRQLWWGHRIPVWYDQSGNSYAGHNEADVRQRYQLAQDKVLKQDEDVLDTWFSSALWPFSTLGWPEKTEMLHTFFPTQLLVTGFDIIFFWVARMMMLSLKFTGTVPFREVYITGLIRDADGQKMSKSKGNVLDPIDLIDGISLEELLKKRTYGLMQPAMAKKIEQATKQEFPQGIASYGTDALRFTFCSFASFTREIRFDIHRLSGYRNFCNKLWNASRFVFMNTDHHQLNISKGEELSFSLADRYIQSQLQLTILQARTALEQYRFDLFAQTLYDFTWNEFCDWYLELAKPALTTDNQSNSMAHATRYMLLHTLECLLRLLHPIMPFITEALWQRIASFRGQSDSSIMLQPYPIFAKNKIDQAAVDEIEWIKKCIISIRTIRSEMNIAPGKMLSLVLRKGSMQEQLFIKRNEHTFKTLAKLESIRWLSADETPPESASAFVGELEIFIPLCGLINQQEEALRLEKEIAKVERDLNKINTKLTNPEFKNKAPASVVAKEQMRQQELTLNLEKLRHQWEKFLPR